MTYLFSQRVKFSFTIHLKNILLRLFFLFQIIKEMIDIRIRGDVEFFSNSVFFLLDGPMLDKRIAGNFF